MDGGRSDYEIEAAYPKSDPAIGAGKPTNKAGASAADITAIGAIKRVNDRRNTQLTDRHSHPIQAQASASENTRTSAFVRLLV